jgi:arylsulfatase A-like enzyme
MRKVFTRRRVLTGLAAAAGCAAVAGGFPYIIRKRAASREAVFLVIMDALRADMVGKVVNGQEVTPNINRLAAEHVYFPRAYAASTFTKFSMASIFSGMYGPGHGVEHEMFALPDCPTIQKFLGGKGYYCAGIVTNPYMDPEAVPGKSGRPVDFGFSSGFEYYRARFGRGREKANDPAGLGDRAREATAPWVRVGYVNGEVVNGALATLLLREVPLFAGGRPLFVYLHYMDTHQPWLPSEPVKGVTGKFHRPGAGTVDEIFRKDVEVVYKVLFSGTPRAELTGEDIEGLKAVYLEAAHFADRGIGGLVDLLKGKGLWEDCTFIFTADHGDELMEHGTVGHHQNLFDTTLRVPLVIKRGRAAGEAKARVSNAMIFPTVAEWFGEEITTTNVPSIAGYLEDPTRGSLPIFGSLYRNNKIVLADGRECMNNKDEVFYFNADADPGEERPLAEDAQARVEMEKARFSAERLAKEAGFKRRFSTVGWQNPWALAQNIAAEALVNRGEITAEESARRRSFGEFLPEEAAKKLAGDLAEIKIDASQLSDLERKQLQALGYLH